MQTCLRIFLESKITHKFVQIGDDSVFTVGRDGETFYDPIHGITVHIPSDSLPYGIEQVKVTVKVGFTDHDFSVVDMVVCSATIVIYCVPQVLFTKDVFLEIPHSSPLDTSNLHFIKFKDDQSEYGEVHKGVFSPDYPYGVIMTNSFSSHVIVKGKRYFTHQSLLKKSSVRHIYKAKFPRLLKKIAKHECLQCDGGACRSLFWFCVSRVDSGNGADCKFSFTIAQYTPTGFQVSS